MRTKQAKHKPAPGKACPAPLPRLGVLAPIVALYGEGLGDPGNPGQTAAEVLLVLDGALALLGYSARARWLLFGPARERCYARLAAGTARAPRREPAGARPPAELPALPDEPGIQRPNAKGRRVA